LVVWSESVAQLVEHRPFKALVLGSSPSALTIKPNKDAVCTHPTKTQLKYPSGKVILLPVIPCDSLQGISGSNSRQCAICRQQGGTKAMVTLIRMGREFGYREA
jgi:hypothetical protein